MMIRDLCLCPEAGNSPCNSPDVDKNRLTLRRESDLCNRDFEVLKDSFYESIRGCRRCFPGITRETQG